MKTKQQNKQEKKNSSELQSRSEQLSGNNNRNSNDKGTPPTPPPQAPPLNPQQSTINRPVRPYVNFAEREYNRQLPVDKILATLRRFMPRQYELAEVVGKWIWITFPEQPAERTRADLSQLGFHWNNTRKCWQHPCGQTLPRGQEEPRQKYTSYFPADQVAA